MASDPGLGGRSGTISPGGRWAFHTWSSFGVPWKAELVRLPSHQRVRTLVDNKELRARLAALKHGPSRFFKVTVGGNTSVDGWMMLPPNFDSTKKYPVLVTVYAGPATNGARETFTTPSPLTEYGFIVLSIDSRSAAGRGKKFLDAIYQKLGTVEIDDQAEGVKALWDRPYIDRNRVGIFGTSYGGYASGLALLRHPDVFAAAASSSPVTDWRHYDSIYTERYMWLPDENKSGYDAGSLMTYADKLKGRLMLYYGTADNNVHPSNMMQLITSLQKSGKSFDVQVGPDRGHSGINVERMMEFFIENLVMRNPGTATAF